MKRYPRILERTPAEEAHIVRPWARILASDAALGLAAISFTVMVLITTAAMILRRA